MPSIISCCRFKSFALNKQRRWLFCTLFFLVDGGGAIYLILYRNINIYRVRPPVMECSVHREDGDAGC